MPLFEPDSDTVTGPLVAGAPEEPVLATDAVQGMVIPGFGTSVQHILALRFTDADDLRSWLRTPGARPSTSAEVMAARNARRAALRAGGPRPASPVMRGIAFSIGGLRRLTPDADQLIDPAFKGGMANRSGLLGDPTVNPADPGHRSQWHFGGSAATTPDLFMVLGAEWSFDLDDAVAELTAALGAAVIFEQRCEMLPGEKEHFGFRDGVSQVGIRGRLSESARHFLTRRWLDPNDPLAKTHARPGQPLVWPGQFVFGYARGSAGPEPVATGGPTWTENGSLMVVRRLRQDVSAFREFIDEESARLRVLPGFADVTAERLAASIVGRWPDGSALVRSPDGPNANDAEDMLRTNAFNYDSPTPPARVCADPLVAREGLAADQSDELRTVAGAPGDPQGLLCPAFAHVRKVNPRDLGTDKGGRRETLDMQMLRRGITWGETYTEGEPQDRADRGLMFMSFQTSIVRQFELISKNWVNRGNAPEGTSGHDLLIGQPDTGDVRAARFHRGGEVQEVAAARRWVVATGGGYFFAPSCPALALLALPEPPD